MLPPRSSLLDLVVILTLSMLAATASAQDRKSATLYVAPGGDDAAAGTAAAPLRTPGAALERSRVERRQRGAQVTIQLRGGTYFLSETLTLTPEDSGLAIVAHPGERPVLSAGMRVEGFREEEDHGRKLWSAKLASSQDFHALYVGGKRAPRTRLPESGFFHIESLPDVSAATAWGAGQKRFVFANGDLRAFAAPQDIEVVALHFWIESRMPIASIDTASRTVELAKRSVFRLTEDHSKTPARYYLENVREVLARPGEWYFDRAQGRLLLVPREGDSIASTEVVVPRLAQVLRLAGRPDDGRFVERVVLRGLGLAHTEAPCPPLGPPNSDLAGPPQAAVTSPGSVFAEGARECSFEDCELVHLGGYGIELAGGCTGCRIVDCEIHDLAAGAIKLGETGIRKEAAWRSGDHLVADNHLHDGGLRHHSAVGIWVGQSGGNRIEHNHIHHFFYTGISLGWTWGYGQSACAGNAIEKNSVHDIGMGLLSDMGGIYTLGVSPGTVIRGNVFHDVESYSYGGWGIYFDEGTTGVVAENNIVYRCKSNGFHQHYGKENVVRNNVFAASRDAQIARTRAEPHLSFTFERNLVWWNSGKLLSGDWSGAGFRRDHNLYFDARTPTADKQQVLGSAGTAGQDASSIVADPLFEDPLHGDFRLRPHSPALGLAFVPIDCSDVGPRPRPRR